jgi:hypothetical protein
MRSNKLGRSSLNQHVMKRLKPLESMIFTIRDRKIITYEKLLPLLQSSQDPSKQRIGLQSKGQT